MRGTANLEQLLDPGSIAIIGATSKKGRVGNIVFEGLLPSGRKLHPVHPKETSIAGHEVYPSVKDLPDGVDLAVVTIGAGRAVEAAEDCAKKGIPHVIVVAGGFGEAGEEGKALQARLKAIPENSGTRILGPNTLGIFLPHAKLDTLFVEHGDKALAEGGGIAFITQSGSVGVEALGFASNIGYGMRAFVGLGNKCDLDEMDFLAHFEKEDETTCLAFYLESLDNGREFLEAAKEASKKKPVVLLKAGRTATGAQAVSSHTGKLAGSDKVMYGALKQYGVQLVFDDEELCDASRALAKLPLPKGNRVAIVTPAGGYGVMGADHIETPQNGVELAMARLTDETQARIKEATLPFAAAANPVDITASADDAMFGATLDALLDDDGVDIIICTAFFAPPGVSDELVSIVAERAREAKKPIIVFTVYGPFTDKYLRMFHDAGAVGFPSIGRAVRAARFLVERARLAANIGGAK